jgi:hypothetical protein
MKRRTWLITIVTSLALGGGGLGFWGQAQGALVYWQNFDGDGVTGDGIADVTPGGGDLGLATGGVNGNASYSATSGVFGGRLNANGGTATAATSSAATTISPGTPITGMGTLSKFTVSFWLNIDSYRTGALNNTHTRALILGDSSIGDINVGALGANSVAFGVRNNTTSVPNPRALDITVNGSSSTALSSVGNFQGIPGTTTTAGQWTFVALTYDGTSVNADNSGDQLIATGGLSSVNGQLYMGTTVATPTRFAVPFTNDFTTHGVATNPSAGLVGLGSAARLFLANSIGSNRGLDGFLDDVRVYDSLLSATEVEIVRQQGLLGIIPEPSSLCLIGIGFIGMMRARRKSSRSGGATTP